MTNEILTQVNQVEGFNPLDFARTIASSTEGAPPSLYLDVKYRILWFRLKYPQGKIRKIIKTLDDKMAVVECCIYKEAGDQDEAYLANGFGQRFYDNTTTYGARYLECAETAAIGRALAAAGFNISSGNDENDEDGIVDAGVQLKQNSTTAASKPPVSEQPPTSEMSAQSSSYTQNSSVEEIMGIMTIDDAKKVVIPFNGQNKGKTLEQVAIEDPGTLNWIINSYSGPNNELRSAAKVLVKAAA